MPNPSLKPAMKSHCSVERTPKFVIERKLLAALDDEDKVAILATKQDLEDMIAALRGYKLAERKGEYGVPGCTLSWKNFESRLVDLAEGKDTYDNP